MADDPWAIAQTNAQPKFKMPPLKNLGDLLDFQRAAIQEAIFHGGTSDENRAKLRHVLATMPMGSLPGSQTGIPQFMQYGAQHYDKMPHFWQGVYDMALDTGTDPLTLETLDTGAIAKTALRVFKPVIEAIDKSHVPVWGPGLMTDIGHGATKLLNAGGDAINKLGRPAANMALGILNRTAAESRELFRRLKTLDAQAMANLTPKQKSAVQKIMHGQVPPEIVQDPAVHAAVAARRALTNNIIRMQAAQNSGGLKTMLGQKFVTSGTTKLKTPERFIPYGERGPVDPRFAGTPRDLSVVPETQPYRLDSKGHLLTDANIPILKTPRFIKVRGKLKPNPALIKPPKNLVVTHMAPQVQRPLPEALQPFAGHPGEFTRDTYRQDYFPARGEGKAVDPNRPADEIDLLAQRNPHALPQSEFHIPSRQVEEFEQAFQGMLKTSARAITANKARAELAKAYGGVEKIPSEIRDILTIKIPAKGTARTVGEKAAEAVKALVGLPKIGIVGTTPIHMFNILALLAAHAPEQIPEAAYHFWNIARHGGDEAKRFQAMLPAIEKGIDVATHEKGGTLLSKMPLNRWTWDWDTAAKMALANKYVRQGKSALDAGVSAANDLVNYKNTSPLTGFARWVMPFATFAEGGLKSVLGAIAKQPAVVEGVNRATGGRFLGGGDHATDVTSYQPPADVGRGLPTYLRSKTSDLVKLPLGLAAGALPHGQPLENWLLSGRTPLGVAGDIATGPIPYARTVLDMIPIHGGKNLRGYTPDSPLNAGVFSTTGISLPTKPKKAAAAAQAVDPHDPWAITPVPEAKAGASATPAPASADPWALHP